MEKNEKILLLIILPAFFVFLFFFQAEKINLATADLGRHLQNGKILLSNNYSTEEKTGLLHTNFFSYTQPDFKFINHHWGSGIIFYLVYAIGGFMGLSWFYLFLSFATFSFFFFLTVKKSNLFIASCTAVFLMPLITDRAEIRPEVFSYLFSGLVFYWLWKLKKEELSFKKALVLISIAQLVWINLHIGFVFGFFIIGAFFLEAVIRFFQKTDNLTLIKKIFYIEVFSVLISLINPNFIKGLLAPINIFKEYGYRLAENQSIFFLQNYGMENSNFLLVKIVSLLIFVGFVFLFIKNKKEFPWSDFIIGTTFTVLSWQSVRNFSHLGLFLLPIISLIAYRSLKNKLKIFTDSTLLTLGMVFLIIFTLTLSSKNLSLHFQKNGLGLMDNVQGAIGFFREKNLNGPIFNNYDIGGYLIFNLYPDEKVFVDNRPEAYPYDFLQKEYIPMQENDEKWQATLNQYNFNVIFFYRQDITPWAQNFLIKRVQDEDWTPIYVDDFNIIFVRNNDHNQEIIQKHRLPKEMFNVK